MYFSLLIRVHFISFNLQFLHIFLAYIFPLIWDLKDINLLETSIQIEKFNVWIL